MGDIRYLIKDVINEVRKDKNSLFVNINEGESDFAQRHAQYVSDEMVKWGNHRFYEIEHKNPYKQYMEIMNHGFFKDTNTEWAVRQCLYGFFSSDGHRKMLSGEAGETKNCREIAAEIAHQPPSGLVVLVIRFL